MTIKVKRPEYNEEIWGMVGTAFKVSSTVCSIRHTYGTDYHYHVNIPRYTKYKLLHMGEEDFVIVTSLKELVRICND